MGDDAAKALSPWHPMTDPVDIKHIGKLQEELGELRAILARILIQGMDERDPDTGAPNRHELEKEVADVRAGIYLLIERWDLDVDMIALRAQEKAAKLRTWHAMA